MNSVTEDPFPRAILLSGSLWTKVGMLVLENNPALPAASSSITEKSALECPRLALHEPTELPDAMQYFLPLACLPL